MEIQDTTAGSCSSICPVFKKEIYALGGEISWLSGKIFAILFPEEKPTEKLMLSSLSWQLLVIVPYRFMLLALLLISPAKYASLRKEMEASPVSQPVKLLNVRSESSMLKVPLPWEEPEVYSQANALIQGFGVYWPQGNPLLDELLAEVRRAGVCSIRGKTEAGKNFQRMLRGKGKKGEDLTSQLDDFLRDVGMTDEERKKAEKICSDTSHADHESLWTRLWYEFLKKKFETGFAEQSGPMALRAMRSFCLNVLAEVLLEKLHKEGYYQGHRKYFLFYNLEPSRKDPCVEITFTNSNPQGKGFWRATNETGEVQDGAMQFVAHVKMHLLPREEEQTELSLKILPKKVERPTASVNQRIHRTDSEIDP